MALTVRLSLDAVILGQGMPAYGPLQRNKYNNENVEHYDYDPAKAKKILEAAGCVMGKDGFYERNGEEIGFVISVGAGDQVRIDMAQAAAQQLREISINVTVDSSGKSGLGRTAGIPDRMGQSALTRTTIRIRYLARIKAPTIPAIPMRRWISI
ncbi:MAG: ABC transporter substrate-binding protein [Lachnospiraceae bacterium]